MSKVALVAARLEFLGLSISLVLVACLLLPGQKAIAQGSSSVITRKEESKGTRLVPARQAPQSTGREERIALHHALEGIAKGDYKTGTIELTKLIARYGESSVPHLYRGHCYLKLGRPQEALSDYDASLKLAPKYMPFNCWWSRAGAYYELGQYLKATRDWSKCTEICTTMCTPYDLSANAYMQMGMSEKALNQLERAFNIKPGGDNLELEKPQWNIEGPKITGKIIAQWDQSIARKPGNADLYLGRAICQFVLKKHQNALDDLSKAMHLNPRLEAGEQLRVLCYLRLKQYDKALAQANQLLSWSPGKVINWILLGHTYLQAGHIEAGIEDLSKRLKATPKNALILYARAWIEEKSRYQEQPLADLNSAVALDPKLVPALQLRASMNQRKGDMNEAVRDLTQCLLLDPENRYSLLKQRSTCYFESGQFKLAVPDLKEMLDLNETSIPHKALAGCYDELKQYIEANQERAKARALDSALLL